MPTTAKPNLQAQPKPSTPTPPTPKATTPARSQPPKPGGPSGSGGGDEAALLETYSATIKAKLVERVNRMGEQRLRLAAMESRARAAEIQKLLDEVCKDVSSAGIKGFKLQTPKNDAIAAVQVILRNDRVGAFGIEYEDYVIPGTGWLYRNASKPVDPDLVLGQGVIRGRSEPQQPGAPVVAALQKVFRDPAGAHAVVNSYVTTPPGSGGMATAAGEIAIASATGLTDNTLGNSPTWQYTFPAPALKKVSDATIASELGVSADQAKSLTDGKIFGLYSDSGAIAGGSIVAFISGSGSNEHMFLTPVQFDPNLAWRAYTPAVEDNYRTRWKRLDQATYAVYKQLATKYELEL
jgi:hypothetical protein